MAEVAPDCISLLDATRLTGARELLTASRPVSLEINLASGSVTAVATADTDLKLAGTPNARLVPGKNVLALSDPNLWKQELGRALQSIGLPAVQTYVAQPPPAVPAHPRACGTPALRAPLRELWKFQGSPMIEISDFASADIDGDGHPETLICAGRELICLDEQGKQRWRFACKQPLLCVCVADINGDKRPEVLCGGKDEFFHILDTSGRLLAEHQMTEQLVIGQGGTRAPYVKSIAAADLDGDGAVEIVVGCTNSNISAFRASDLSRLWNFNGIYHGVGRIALADLDGDGKLETLVSDHYGSLHVIRSDGRRKVSAYSELGDVIFDAGDINGDGKLELLNGSSTGVLTASAYPIKPLWSFNNYGYAARCVLARDLDGDGKAKTIVGSDMGYLFALGSDGKPKWQLEVGSAILALEYAAVLPKEPSPVADPPPAGKVLIAALRHGALLVISPKGQVLRRMPQPSPVTKILTVPAAGRPDCLLVLDESNAVRFVELSP
jgi:outer membrane protein assembly factor BamB